METFIISLGGSLIVPGEIDVDFLKKFRNLILSYVKKGNKFVIISGGGHVVRKYQKAASQITHIDDEDLDWLGIHGTRLNAHLLRTIFRKIAHPVIIKNPNIRPKHKKQVLIAAGYKPGCSTDYDAVLLAKSFGVKTVINLSNIDYVYDKDPKKHSDAKRLEEVSWKDFRKLVGDKWDPGLNMPFDPIASKESERLKLKVVILGKDIENLKNFFENKSFKGTVIS